MAVNHQILNNPMIRKLESIFRLSEDEKAVLEAVPMQVQIIRENQDIVREGDRPSRCCVLLEGYGCTYKLTGDGKRQIMGFYIPGDIPDLQSLHLRALDTSIGTITACRVGFIPHEIFRDLCRSHPRIAAALWRETLVDASIFREWMTNIGRREALSRIAHLFCEWVLRLKAIDLFRENACTFPVTQNELGDALGVSTVHVNRILQELRGMGLISLRGSTLTVLDWEQLQRVGDFNVGYLHLEPELAAA